MFAWKKYQANWIIKFFLSHLLSFVNVSFQQDSEELITAAFLF